MHKRNFGFTKGGRAPIRELDLRAAAESAGSWTPTPTSMLALTLVLLVFFLVVLPILGVK